MRVPCASMLTVPLRAGGSPSIPQRPEGRRPPILVDHRSLHERYRPACCSGNSTDCNQNGLFFIFLHSLFSRPGADNDVWPQMVTSTRYRDPPQRTGTSVRGFPTTGHGRSLRSPSVAGAMPLIGAEIHRWLVVCHTCIEGLDQYQPDALAGVFPSRTLLARRAGIRQTGCDRPQGTDKAGALSPRAGGLSHLLRGIGPIPARSASEDFAVTNLVSAAGWSSSNRV